MTAPVVSVFGGSAPRPGEAAYQQAEALGRELARSGFAVATGGYIGTMEAVSRGAAGAGGWVVGVTCDRIEAWRGQRPNAWVREEVRCQTLWERAFRLVSMGTILVALPGGIGTLSELALALSLLQTGEIPSRPLLAVGPTWRTLVESLLGQPGGYTRPEDGGLIEFVPDVDGALARIREGTLPGPDMGKER